MARVQHHGRRWRGNIVFDEVIQLEVGGIDRVGKRRISK